MNDRGHYGNVGVAPPGATEQQSRGVSWGGLTFFTLVGGGLLLLVRPHYKEARELERARARGSRNP
jgi:hypothetical protein